MGDGRGGVPAQKETPGASPITPGVAPPRGGDTSTVDVTVVASRDARPSGMESKPDLKSHQQRADEAASLPLRAVLSAGPPCSDNVQQARTIAGADGRADRDADGRGVGPGRVGLPVRSSDRAGWAGLGMRREAVAVQVVAPAGGASALG